MKILHPILFILVSAFALADNTFQQGIDAYHDSDYESASRAFETAVAVDETAAAHHNLALALYQSGKVSQAAWHLQRALLLEPNNEEYHFKLGALRQQLGLINQKPEWYELVSKALGPQAWILLLCVCFWMTLAAMLLPWISGCEAHLLIKAFRALGLTGLILACSALYLNRDLSRQGIVLADTPATLHAAPASAAPQTGLARPGERALAVDWHGDYIEIETEGGARGWIGSGKFKKLL